jgi:chloramphenicol-sensitive protein RarD
MNKGIFYALAAYLTWGFFPLYWRWLDHVSALELIGHRVVWSFVIMALVMLLTRRWDRLKEGLQQPGVVRSFLFASALIGVNWLIYVWAVNSGYIVESSLGYFINPLVSVLLGVLILKERLRPWQWLPVGVATAGVLYLTISYGSLPWISLSLAFSFGLYGLVKKTTPLGAVTGMFTETAMLFLPALGVLLYYQFRGNAAFLHTGLTADLLMAGAGFVTAIPLLFFARATRSIPLTLIGVLQYLAPTLQFLIGVLVFKESVPPDRWIGFSIIWLALILFAVEGLLSSRRKPVPLAI